MKKYILTIIKLIISILSIYTIIELKHLNILPNKYIMSLTILIVILNILTIKKLKIINTISYIILIPLLLILIKYTLNTKRFLKTGFNNNNIEIKTYNVLVLKENNKTIEQIEKTGYIKNILQKTYYMENLNMEKQEYINIYELYEDLTNKKIESITLHESYIDLLEDEYEDIREVTKIIYSFNIKEEKDKQQEISDLVPINIYISGSDSRSGLTENSRTDVNMIVTINPKTKQILLTSIPRDYYVRLHGTTGYKDKLTHSGIYGIEMSKTTIEDLFNIKIDYTIKVGFNSVISIVDLIGGIDIESDQTFTTRCGDGGAEKTHIVEGKNHLTGPQALSYARERYAYIEGDNHRIQNQQQVLEAIIEKSFKSKSIILKYNEFLENFKNLYRTDIPETLIKLYIKEQLNNNTTWKIEKQVVKGTGSMDITYSMPGRKLYVMIPNMETVENATKNINNLKNLTD